MMILNWIHGSRSREFALGAGSLYSSSVPSQQDICMLSPTSRVPMTAAGAQIGSPEHNFIPITVYSTRFENRSALASRQSRILLYCCL